MPGSQRLSPSRASSPVPSSQLSQSTLRESFRSMRTSSVRIERFEAPRGARAVGPAQEPPRRAPAPAPHAAHVVSRRHGRWSSAAQTEQNHAHGQYRRGPVPISPGRHRGTLTVLGREARIPASATRSSSSSSSASQQARPTANTTVAGSPPTWSSSAPQFTHPQLTYATATSGHAVTAAMTRDTAQESAHGQAGDTEDDQSGNKGRSTDFRGQAPGGSRTATGIPVSDFTQESPSPSDEQHELFQTTTPLEDSRIMPHAVDPNMIVVTIAKQHSRVSTVGQSGPSSQASRPFMNPDARATESARLPRTSRAQGSIAQADEEDFIRFVASDKPVIEAGSASMKNAIETFGKQLCSSDDVRDKSGAQRRTPANVLSVSEANLTKCREALKEVDQLAAVCARDACDRIDAAQRTLLETQSDAPRLGKVFRNCQVFQGDALQDVSDGG